MTSVPRRLMALTLAGALFVPAFVAGGSGVAAKESGKRPSKYYDLDKSPKPTISGKEIIGGLEDFVARFPFRNNRLPNNIAAAEFLAEEAEGYGFKARILEFEVPSLGGTRTVRVVEAIKRGTTKPNEWISFVAHYDAVAPDGAGATVQGAYDDASGTNMLRYFAKGFSKIKTNRSIVMLWFDAEENGLLASKAYADMVEKRGQKMAGVLGFDMVGIGYPARYCICIYHGPTAEDAAKAQPIIDYVNFQYLKFPEGDGGAGAAAKWPIGTEGHVCSCGPNIRNSDERNLAAKGYFSIRWTGMRTAADYPGYHMPWDTVPFMAAVAGGRETLEMGTENTFNSAWYTTFVLDNLKTL